MSNDVLADLRAYGEHHDAMQRPVRLDEARTEPVVRMDLAEEPRPERPGRARGWLLVAAAAAALVIAVMVLVRPGTESERAVIDSPESDVVEPPGTPSASAPGPTVSDDAALMVTGYLAAWEAGDVDTVLAAHADEVAVVERRFPDTAWRYLVPQREYEAFVRWTAAMGRRFDGESCRSEGETGGVTAVVCVFDMFDAVSDELSAVAIASTLRVELDREGIRELRWYSSPSPDTHSVPFETWLREHHPDALDDVSFDPTDSADELQRAGRARREYARRWAQFGSDVAEATFESFRSGDVEAFLSTFRDAPQLIVDADEAMYADLASAGVSIDARDCAPSGVSGSDLAVTCQLSIVDPAGTTVDSVSVRIVIGPDGRIQWTSGAFDADVVTDLLDDPAG